jgi:hypothetical protein
MASFGIIGTAGTGTVRIIAGLSLLCALACACWLLHEARPCAAAPAAGLALACLVLTGTGLAAAHALRAVPVALAISVLTLAAAWASAVRRGPRPADSARTPSAGGARTPLNLLALAGAGIFAAAAVLAIHYAADSATADAGGASSLAIWAYPAGGRLQVGVQAPAGHGAVSLRIVVTQAGAAARAWNNVRVAPGQTWEAPAFAPRGRGPVQVVALEAGIAVATVSASPA